MKTRKLAFSLPEILITMGIIGIVSILGLTMIKPNERALVFQYYNAYNTLRTAVFNIQQDAIDANYSINTTFTELDKKFADNAKELCQKLAVNPAAYNDGVTEDKTRLGYINTTRYNCEDFTKTVEKFAYPDKEELTNEYLAFQSSNSMRYYLSDKFEIKVKDDLNNNEVKKEVFWVLVDINGPRKPNTAVWNKNKPADIVPFLITTGGQVIPAGYPTVDRRYMSASVKIFDGNIEKYLQTSFSYRDAQKIAFNDLQYPTVDPSSIYKTVEQTIRAEVDTTQEQHEDCKATTGFPAPCTIEIDGHSRDGF